MFFCYKLIKHSERRLFIKSESAVAVIEFSGIKKSDILSRSTEYSCTSCFRRLEKFGRELSGLKAVIAECRTCFSYSTGVLHVSEMSEENNSGMPLFP